MGTRAVLHIVSTPQGNIWSRYTEVTKISVYRHYDGDPDTQLPLIEKAFQEAKELFLKPYTNERTGRVNPDFKPDELCLRTPGKAITMLLKQDPTQYELRGDVCPETQYEYFIHVNPKDHPQEWVVYAYNTEGSLVFHQKASGGAA